MSVETNAKFITELNEAYPRRGDLLKEGDDHMRLIKSVIKNTLPGFNRTINITSEKLNHIDSMVDTTENTLTIKGDLKVSDKKNVDLGGNIVHGVSDPVEDTDAANKQFVKKEGVGFAWPVGAIFMTVDTRDPKDIFGFGEWEKFATGRVIIGTGSDKDANNEAKLIALNATGGTYNETLTDKQIPAHSHDGEGLVLDMDESGAHAHNVRQDGKPVTAWVPGGHGATSGGPFDTGGHVYTEEAGKHKHTGRVTGKTSNSGGGEKHNNMMPYIGVNIWKRTK